MAYKVKMTNTVCESYNKTIVVFTECRLKAISRNKTTLTVLVNLTRIYDMKIRFQLFKKENGYKPWLMDYRTDLCKLMLKINHPVAKLLLDLLKDTLSFNHPCPFEVGII